MAETYLNLEANELLSAGIARFNKRVDEAVEKIKLAIVQAVQYDRNVKEIKLSSYHMPPDNIQEVVFATLAKSGIIIREKKRWFFANDIFVSGWNNKNNSNTNPYR